MGFLKLAEMTPTNKAGEDQTKYPRKGLLPNIIFIGFNRADEFKTTPVSWKNIYYKNENIKKYNGIMKEVREKNNILFLDIFGLLNNDDLEDGLHPNASGHKKIFTNVCDFLSEHKWI